MTEEIEMLKRMKNGLAFSDELYQEIEKISEEEHHKDFERREREELKLDEGIEALKNGDYKTALIMLRPLAEQGNHNAQYNLGVMHDNGWGVPKDDTEAVKWYREAAEQGDAGAQDALEALIETEQKSKEMTEYNLKLMESKGEISFKGSWKILGGLSVMAIVAFIILVEGQIGVGLLNVLFWGGLAAWYYKRKCR